jgi:hypothetical protein
MAPLTREKRLNVLVTEDERAQLQALADREGMKASDYVRQCIRRNYAATFGELPAKATKTRKRK